jgi:hypothetical protein
MKKLTEEQIRLAIRVDDRYQDLREADKTWDSISNRLVREFGREQYDLWLRWERRFHSDRDTIRAEAGYAQ